MNNNLYFSRLLNALAWVGIAALIIMQRDVENVPLISGYHGLGVAALVSFGCACLNFRGAISAIYGRD